MDDPQPGGRLPAPGRLGLVQSFVNTVDLESGVDEIQTPQRLQAWLVERGLLEAGDPVVEEDVRRVMAVREGLRALAVMNNEGRLQAGRVRELNRVASGVLLTARFAPSGELELLSVSPGVDGVLARIISAAATASLDGTWSRVKACRRDVCRWMFYDHSRNRSGVWCAMAVCGSRTKAFRYRRRHGSGGAAAVG
jgi:predicted RNA-binding Zn ribbon-like protein